MWNKLDIVSNSWVSYWVKYPFSPPPPPPRQILTPTWQRIESMKYTCIYMLYDFEYFFWKMTKYDSCDWYESNFFVVF